MPQRKRTSQRPPWWMYFIGLSYLVTLAVILYLVIWGPAEMTGIITRFSGDAMEIESVLDSSLEATAGLRPGDRVLMIDDRPIRTVRDWTMSTGNLEVGRLQRWLISRGDDRLTIEIVPVSSTFRYKWTVDGYNHYLSLLVPGFFIG